ncbi:MAG: TIGR01440 family protein [Salinivirgaceae bacterium]|nr:TIGR01440 family protein [Salinivirgaceae bacterium]
METIDLKEIAKQTEQILTDLLNAHPMAKGSVFVIGCSSSEVAGGLIGKNSSAEIGATIFATAFKILSERGVYLACQCCEHLNRALVVEAECAERYSYEPVSVVPWLHGGGSFATAAYHGFAKPVVVEHIKAAGGLDIGDTLIGMHLKDVAVPVHPTPNSIGCAHVVAAFCRPKLIGGERARYVKG